MQQVLWLVFILMPATADDANVLEVGKGLKLSGTLDKAKPQQVYRVKLEKGGVYVIDMVSPNPRALDPFLRLVAASGKTLIEDDDSGGGLNARIIFLAPATGAYRIAATSFGSAGAGAFTLAIKRDDARLTDALEARVQFLKSAGKSAEALVAARELVKARERSHGPSHWRTVNARWQMRKLETLASLPASGKAELAEAQTLHTRAVQLFEKGNYAQAAPLYEKVLAIHRKVLGEEHPDTTVSCNNLAVNLDAQTKYAEAAPLYEKVLVIQRKILGEEHPDTAASCNNLAVNLSARGKYAQAALLLDKALAIRRKILGEEHADTALSYNNVAASLNARGKYTEAAPLYQKALAIRRKILGEEHADTAGSYNNLAANLTAQGKYSEAAPLLEKALAIRHRILGEAHPDTAQSYNNLAVNLDDQSKYAEAAPLYEKALAINRKILGEEHADTAVSYNNLAHNLSARGKYAQAALLLDKALDIRRKILGEEHPDTAASYNNLAYNLNAQAKYVEAAPIHKKVLAIWRGILGEEHPYTALSYNNLAYNLDAQGKYAEAAPLYQKALDIHRKLLGEDHPDTARGYGGLAACLTAQGKYAEAAPLLEKTLAIRRKILGEEHADTALSYNNVAANLNAQSKYAEAAPLFESALAIYRILGEEHPRAALSYDNLAYNLNARGKYADAEKAWTNASRIYGIARLRSAATGLERASFAAKASVAASLGACLARNGKNVFAWQNLESSLARGLLEDITSAPRFPRPIAVDESRRERDLLARLDQLDKQILQSLTAANKEKAASKQLERILAQRRQAGEELAKLEGVVASRQVYNVKRIQRRIPANAAFVTWVDIQGQPKAKDPNGEHWACVLRRLGPPAWIKLPGSGSKGEWTKEDDEVSGRFRKLVANPAAAFDELRSMRAHLAVQRLKPLEPALAATKDLPAVSQLLVAPVGWMAGIPVEALTDSYTVTYVPSGTMFARLREKPGREPNTEGQLLAIGDPRFRKPEKLAALPPPPDHGVLIVKAIPGGNAARSGLKGEDVLLSYNGKKLAGQEDLAPAIKNARGKKEVLAQVWRDGKTLSFKVAAGPLGVQVSKEPAARAIMARREGDALLYKVRGVRGGNYLPLPGTRAEVAGIARLFRHARTLLQSDASEQQLYALARKGELKEYRFLHFATHGEVDDRVSFNSALILSQDRLPHPAEAMVPDAFLDGRLTAEEISKWTKDGKPLLDADLVVLSACQSGLGRKAGGEGYLGFRKPSSWQALAAW